MFSTAVIFYLFTTSFVVVVFVHAMKTGTPSSSRAFADKIATTTEDRNRRVDHAKFLNDKLAISLGSYPSSSVRNDMIHYDDHARGEL